MMDIDYSVLQEFLEADENLGGTHWAVPGPDKKEGFGGTCLPKDLTHASSLLYNTHNIMNTALEANKELDINEEGLDKLQKNSTIRETDILTDSKFFNDKDLRDGKCSSSKCSYPVVN